MKQIVYILMIVFFLSTVFAEPDFYYKQNENIDIKIPCYNEDAICSSSAECNITIIYPNGTTFVNNQEMQNNNPNPNFNYTLLSSDVVGVYSSYVICIDGLESDNTQFEFMINKNGIEENNNINLIMFLTLVFMILIYVSVSFLLNKEHIILKISFFVGSFVNLLALMFAVYFMFVTSYQLDKVLLYIIEANGIFVFMLISYYFIYLAKKSTPDSEDKNDWVN